MTYKVIDIEGVGEVYAEKLIAAGVKTDAELLEKCAKPAGRKALEAETKLHKIMNDIYDMCVEYGKQKDGSINYVKGANIAGFMRVAKAMLAQGII